MPEEQPSTASPASVPSSSPAVSQPSPSGQASATVSSPPTQTSQPSTERPSWVPEDFWDANGKQINGESFRKSFDELRAYKAQEDIKAATRPKSPSDYKVELPESFKPPEGIEFKFKEDDPLLAQARQWAHKRGLDQDAFQEALELYAGAQVGTAAQIKAAREAEVAKLGTAGPARVDAVWTWLKATVGEESAKSLAGMMVTADIVSGLEKIITKFANQGTGQFNGNGREPQSRTPTDEEWARMNWNERRDYQRQTQSNSQGRR